MRLDKYEIKKNKFTFIMLVFSFFVGIILMIRITDFMTETVEMEAVVTRTYKSHSGTHFGTHSHGKRKPKMNLEWVDLHGQVQTDGNLFNGEHLKAGDTCTILVDAKTHSRRILSKVGSVVMFGIGVLFCSVSFIFIKILFERKE